MNEAVAVPEMTHSSNYFDQDRQLDGIPRKLLLTEPAPVALRAVDRRTPLDADTDEYERAASAELYRKYPTCRYSSTPLSTISVQQQYLADNELRHASFKQASYLEQGLPQCQKQLRKIRQHPLRDTSPHHRQRYSAPTSLSIDNGLYEEVEDDYQQPEDHALWILVRSIAYFHSMYSSNAFTRHISPSSTPFLPSSSPFMPSLFSCYSHS